MTCAPPEACTSTKMKESKARRVKLRLRPCRLPLWPRWACRCCWAPDPCSGTAASCPAAVAPAPAAAAATPGTPAPAAAASAAARPAAAPRSASSCTPAHRTERRQVSAGRAADIKTTRITKSSNKQARVLSSTWPVCTSAKRNLYVTLIILHVLRPACI